ncbi:MAG: 4Fe-4S binding protein [Spirochaetales bacterium]|nr:4Fe-4S binding protein [Spirochaetales bacterium]
MKRSKAERRKSARIRFAVQLFVFILVALISINHSLEEKNMEIKFFSSASLHAICPFGGVVSIYQVLTGDGIVHKVHESSFILMVIVFLLAIAFGPVLCGWICPYGTFQEWLGKIGKKIFKKKFNAFIPYKIDKWLRYLRYVMFVWVLIMTIKSGELFFLGFDPYFVLYNFWTSEVALAGYIVFGITIVLSLFVERPFCKYACPYGALLGLFNSFRIFKIRRNTQTCIDCKACDKACPMNIPVSEKSTVYNHQCISCLKCTSEQACPVDTTVDFASTAYAVTAKEAAK